jgi:rfaE bifunctional protein nucleotidyltransferase chain/domain
MSRGKQIPWDKLCAWRKKFKGRLVVTNGCFDVIHIGHIRYLQAAAQRGDLLLVGVNSDQAVRMLKGQGRPIFPAAERAEMLAALECVGAVCIFPGMRATRFLAKAMPAVWVKGGDYTLEKLDSTERETVRKAGGEILLMPVTPQRSTTRVLNHFNGLSHHD